MDHYRNTENEKIIIDARLSELEKQFAKLRAWKLSTGVLLGISFLLTCGGYVLTRRASESGSLCRDEVHIVTINGFSSKVDSSCSHSKHRSVLTTDPHHAETTIHCSCQ